MDYRSELFSEYPKLIPKWYYPANWDTNKSAIRTEEIPKWDYSANCDIWNAVVWPQGNPPIRLDRKFDRRGRHIFWSEAYSWTLFRKFWHTQDFLALLSQGNLRLRLIPQISPDFPLFRKISGDPITPR